MTRAHETVDAEGASGGHNPSDRYALPTDADTGGGAPAAIVDHAVPQRRDAVVRQAVYSSAHREEKNEHLVIKQRTTKSD